MVLKFKIILEVMTLSNILSLILTLVSIDQWDNCNTFSCVFLRINIFVFNGITLGNYLYLFWFARQRSFDSTRFISNYLIIYTICFFIKLCLCILFLASILYLIQVISHIDIENAFLYFCLYLYSVQNLVHIVFTCLLGKILLVARRSINRIEIIF
jgi:hypothetical protein